MKSIYFIISLLILISCKKSNDAPETKIAFGSCGSQEVPLPILGLAADYKPDYFIFLGDNIYGDTDSMSVLKAKYKKLGDKVEYQKLQSVSKILATWDDHDYGRNDSGKEYPYKKESKEIFLEFFKEPAESERRKHDGIYHAEYVKNGNRTIQFILLDVRTFRDALIKYDGKQKLPRDYYFYKPEYGIHQSLDKTLLGEEQWVWLEKELKKPADLRFICSGSQFGIEYNGYEAWANFPHEQEKMLNLIKTTKANGVIFLTGDVHYAEISKLQKEGLYPIYDVTSSGISSVWDFATQNNNRIEGPVMENHFGLITVSWQKDPKIKMEIIDYRNNHRCDYELNLSEISFK